jgi:hypothetical protein
MDDELFSLSGKCHTHTFKLIKMHEISEITIQKFNINREKLKSIENYMLWNKISYFKIAFTDNKIKWHLAGVFLAKVAFLIKNRL